MQVYHYASASYTLSTGADIVEGLSLLIVLLTGRRDFDLLSSLVGFLRAIRSTRPQNLAAATCTEFFGRVF